MGRPAARVGDLVEHKAPPMLTPGPGSQNVFIGGKPAWRGLPAGAAAQLKAMKESTDQMVQAAETATAGAAGTPGAPGALAAEQTTKASILGSASASMSSFTLSATVEVQSDEGSGGGKPGQPDIHVCTTPTPTPPHGPGMIIDGSKTVFINGLPACREGDTILEALGPPNKVKKGLATVHIGDDTGAAPMLIAQAIETAAAPKLKMRTPAMDAPAAPEVHKGHITAAAPPSTPHRAHAAKSHASHGHSGQTRKKKVPYHNARLEDIPKKYAPTQDNVSQLARFFGRTVTDAETNLMLELQARNPTRWVLREMTRLQNEAITEANRQYPRPHGVNAEHWANLGHNDAFRHAYWSARMTQIYGEDWVRRFTTAHEGIATHVLPVREQQDLYNNEVGRQIGKAHQHATPAQIAALVRKALNDGKLTVVDRRGHLQWANHVKIGEHGNAHELFDRLHPTPPRR